MNMPRHTNAEARWFQLITYFAVAALAGSISGGASEVNLFFWWCVFIGAYACRMVGLFVGPYEENDI